MQTTKSLASAMREVFPNATAVMANGPDPDSAHLPWDDCEIVITQWCDDDTFQLALYNDTDYSTVDGAVPVIMVDVPADVDRTVALVDWLTETHEEGETSFVAWATHWFSEIGGYRVTRGFSDEVIAEADPRGETF